jgi:hypothetical protein
VEEAEAADAIKKVETEAVAKLQLVTLGMVLKTALFY